MNREVGNNERKPKGKTLMILLSLISLAFTVLGSFGVFIKQEYLLGELVLAAPTVSELINYMFRFVPCILLFIFILMEHRVTKAKKRVLFLLILFFVAVHPLYGGISASSFLNTLSDLAVVIFFALAVICVFRDSKNKCLLIIATLMGLLNVLCNKVSSIPYLVNLIEVEFYFALIVSLFNTVGSVIFHITLFLIALNRKSEAESHYSPSIE